MTTPWVAALWLLLVLLVVRVDGRSSSYWYTGPCATTGNAPNWLDGTPKHWTIPQNAWSDYGSSCIDTQDQYVLTPILLNPTSLGSGLPYNTIARCMIPKDIALETNPPDGVADIPGWNTEEKLWQWSHLTPWWSRFYPYSSSRPMDLLCTSNCRNGGLRWVSLKIDFMYLRGFGYFFVAMDSSLPFDHCQCPFGHTGALCQDRCGCKEGVEYCDNGQCTCADHSGSSCSSECAPGWFGTECQNYIVNVAPGCIGGQDFVSAKTGYCADLPGHWDVGVWGGCGPSCIQFRTVRCLDSMSQVLDDSSCALAGPKPLDYQLCTGGSCPPPPAVYITGNWTQCSQFCEQERTYRCAYANTPDQTQSNSVCVGQSVPIPETSRRCAGDRCPVSAEPDAFVWKIEGWSQCDASCNYPKSRRVTCVDANTQTETFPDAICEQYVHAKPVSDASCFDFECTGQDEHGDFAFEWVTSAWGPCNHPSNCQRSHLTECRSIEGNQTQVYSDDVCLNLVGQSKPTPDADTETCNFIEGQCMPNLIAPSSTYRWEVSPWSSCQSDCTQVRVAFCYEIGTTTQYPSSRCQQYTGYQPVVARSCYTDSCVSPLPSANQVAWVTRPGLCSRQCTQNATVACVDTATHTVVYDDAVCLHWAPRPATTTQACTGFLCAARAWKQTWRECDTGCTQSATEVCVQTNTGQQIDDAYCYPHSATGPSPRSCYGGLCPTTIPADTYNWVTGSFSQCSESCQETRSVRCQGVDGTSPVVDPDLCTTTDAGPRPNATEPCTGDVCVWYSWFSAPAGPCSTQCLQTTTVVCLSHTAYGEFAVDDGFCVNSGLKPPSLQVCTGGSCITPVWIRLSQGVCSFVCNRSVEYACVESTNHAVVYDNSVCGTPPPSSELCTGGACGQYVWFEGYPFSPCSNLCVQTRPAPCATMNPYSAYDINNHGVDDHFCQDQLGPNPVVTSQSCTDDSCSPVWTPDVYGPCSFFCNQTVTYQCTDSVDTHLILDISKCGSLAVPPPAISCSGDLCQFSSSSSSSSSSTGTTNLLESSSSSSVTLTPSSSSTLSAESSSSSGGTDLSSSSSSSGAASSSSGTASIEPPSSSSSSSGGIDLLSSSGSSDTAPTDASSSSTLASSGGSSSSSSSSGGTDLLSSSSSSDTVPTDVSSSSTLASSGGSSSSSSSLGGIDPMSSSSSSITSSSSSTGVDVIPSSSSGLSSLPSLIGSSSSSSSTGADPIPSSSSSSTTPSSTGLGLHSSSSSLSLSSSSTAGDLLSSSSVFNLTLGNQTTDGNATLPWIDHSGSDGFFSSPLNLGLVVGGAVLAAVGTAAGGIAWYASTHAIPRYSRV